MAILQGEQPLLPLRQWRRMGTLRCLYSKLDSHELPDLEHVNDGLPFTNAWRVFVRRETDGNFITFSCPDLYDSYKN
eukprot:COSAG01_NODE_24025_length_793_cov_1.328530_1_plen_76_part_01